jgi:hypothetical protein
MRIHRSKTFIFAEFIEPVYSKIYLLKYNYLKNYICVYIFPGFESLALFHLEVIYDKVIFIEMSRTILFDLRLISDGQ